MIWWIIYAIGVPCWWVIGGFVREVNGDTEDGDSIARWAIGAFGWPFFVAMTAFYFFMEYVLYRSVFLGLSEWGASMARQRRR